MLRDVRFKGLSWLSSARSRNIFFGFPRETAAPHLKTDRNMEDGKIDCHISSCHFPSYSYLFIPQSFTVKQFRFFFDSITSFVCRQVVTNPHIKLKTGNATYIFNFDMWKIVAAKMCPNDLCKDCINLPPCAFPSTSTHFCEFCAANQDMTCTSLHGCEAPYLVEPSFHQVGSFTSMNRCASNVPICCTKFTGVMLCHPICGTESDGARERERERWQSMSGGRRWLTQWMLLTYLACRARFSSFTGTLDDDFNIFSKS